MVILSCLHESSNAAFVICHLSRFRQLPPLPMAAAAARFLFQLDALDRDATVDAFAHVVNGQGRDGHGRQGLHFDARLGLDRHRGLDGQRPVVGRCEVHRHGFEASGWHSGIKSAVRLAAMMPASRATSSTSPFRWLAAGGSRPAFRPPSAPGPLARATRRAIGFSPTSTMRLAPAASKWLSSPIGGLVVGTGGSNRPKSPHCRAWRWAVEGSAARSVNRKAIPRINRRASNSVVPRFSNRVPSWNGRTVGGWRPRRERHRRPARPRGSPVVIPP